MRIARSTHPRWQCSTAELAVGGVICGAVRCPYSGRKTTMETMEAEAHVRWWRHIPSGGSPQLYYHDCSGIKNHCDDANDFKMISKYDVIISKAASTFAGKSISSQKYKFQCEIVTQAQWPPSSHDLMRLRYTNNIVILKIGFVT